MGLALALVSFTGPAHGQGRDVDAEAVVQPWYNCVGYTYGRHSRTIHQLDVAIQAAFLDCRAEENRVRAWAGRQGLPPGEIEFAINHHKTRLKNGFLESDNYRR